MDLAIDKLAEEYRAAHAAYLVSVEQEKFARKVLSQAIEARELADRAQGKAGGELWHALREWVGIKSEYA